jgi:multiple sugar transport system substrate-binding protein
LGGILLTRTPPALAQKRELKLLIWSLFVPAAVQELSRQCKEFGKQEGIKVRVDRVAQLRISDIHASQIQEQKGHDMTCMWIGEPYLYAKHLMELDDLVETIGQRAGGWTNESIGRGEDGHYRAIPWYFVSFPVVVRTDLVAAIGEDLPDTWEDVHRIGKVLKAKGYPTGIQIARSLDSNAILRGIIWSWGGKEVEADSKTVAFNSPETVEAYKFIKTLYEDCMEAEVLAWGDLNNNVCLNSGKCSMILNPVSAYNSARKDNTLLPGTNRPVHQMINHVMPPKGPAGRHMGGAYNVIGIWNWTPVPEAARAFLEFHFQKEQQEKFLTASSGYNQPLLRALSLHPIYAANPKFYFHPYIDWYTHAPGWPGAPTAAMQAIWDKHIIPETVAECVTGKLSAEEAVKKAEFQINHECKRWA